MTFWQDFKALAKGTFVGTFLLGMALGAILSSHFEFTIAVAIMGVAFTVHARQHRKESNALIAYADEARHEADAIERVWKRDAR